MTISHTATPFYRYEVELARPHEAPTTCTVLYCAQDDVVVTRLSDQLNSLADDRLIPDRIILMGRQPALAALRSAAVHERVREMLPQVTRQYATPELDVVTFGRDGSMTAWTWNSDDDPPRGERLAPGDEDAMRQAGLRAIMRQRGVVLSTIGYHFAKPSSRHSNRFIRTANALRYSSEVSFIAACLLHLLPDHGFDRVYTDTSTINSVAYALKDHVRSFVGAEADFTIDSFGSHSGADGDFNLSGASQTLVLVSASTSGGLVDKIVDRQHIDRSRIITLCYVGRPVLENIVCDLTLRVASPTEQDRAELHEPFPNWEADECRDCASGSSVVLISGDQFLPASPSISMEAVKQVHAPPWLSPLCEQLTGLGVIRCHVATREGTEPRSLFLDFGPVIDVARVYDPTDTSVAAPRKAMASQVHRRVLRDVPAGTKWIVYLDDDASRGLAGLANAHLGSVATAVPDDRMIKAADLIVAPETFEMDGLVLVVASAVVSGRSILSVSQALRVAHGVNPISYLVLAARTASRGRVGTLRTNLGYGNGRFGEHHVSILVELTLPDDRESISSPWSQEVQLWKSIRDRTDVDARPGDVHWLSERIDLLENAGSRAGTGLTDGLFLTNQVDGPALRLQPNFAFWDFAYEPERVAQSEVYFVVSAVLHRMRTELDLLTSGAHEHNWTVLDPATLARFNDPAIQAAFLRAAHPYELDYTGRRQYSQDMAAVIAPLVRGWRNADGGAAGEVLLALATRRLQLHPDDLRDIRGLLDESDLPEPLALLTEALAQLTT